MRIEHTRHSAYTFEDIFGILAHKERIRQEEILALRYQVAKMEHNKWSDVEYYQCHKWFAAIYDGMMEEPKDNPNYIRLKDLYHTAWMADYIMPNARFRERIYA